MKTTASAEMVKMSSSLELVGNKGSIQILKNGEAVKITAKAGEKYRIVKKHVTSDVLADDVVATKVGDTLQLQYADGTQVSLEGFYQVEGAELALPANDGGVHTVSSQMALSTDSSNFVYAHGDHNTLMSMTQDNHALQMAVAQHTSVSNLPHYAELATGVATDAVAGTASAGGAAAGTAAATGAAAGMSTAAMVGLGALGVAGVAVAAGGGGGGSSAPAAAAAPAAATTNLAVHDGYVRGASVYIDTNNNGTLEVGTDTLIGTTDANGHLNVTSSVIAGKTLLMTGGTDISTGVAFNGVMKASAGSDVINPLTTLVQQIAGAGANAAAIAAAETKVKAVFGLDAGINLATTDLFADLSGAAALTVQKVAIQIANIIAVTVATLDGNSTTATETLAEGTMVALAATISGASNQIDLTDTTTITNLITLSATNNSVNTAGITIADISTAVSSANTAIAQVDSLSQVVQIQTLTQGTIVTNLADGYTAGDVSAYTSADAVAVASVVVNGSTLAITSSQPALKAGDTATLTFTFSGGTVTGFTIADVQLESGTLSNFAETVAGTTYTATYTPAVGKEDAAMTMTVLGSSYTFSAGTAANETSTLDIDTLAPTATITMADTALKIGDTSLVTITFSEAVAGFANADVTVAGGTLTTLTSADNITWTGTFTPTTPLESTTNVISLATSYTDIALNAGTAATSANYAIDTTAPATPTVAELTTTLLSNSLMNAAEAVTTAFRVTLPTSGSLAVAGDSVELLIGGVAFGTPKIAVLSDTDITNRYVDFTVGIAAFGADGTKALTAKITDIAGNAGTASAAVNFTLDTTADTGSDLAVAITATALNGTSAATAAYTILGLDADATATIVFTDAAGSTITLTGITASGTVNLTTADNSTPFIDGTITATIAATDAAANTATGTGDTVALDNTAPTVVSVALNDTSISESNAAATVTATITFSEAMDQASTPVIANNAATTLTTAANGTWTSATTYTIQYTVVDANVDLANITFNVSAATDLAGNTQTAATGVLTGTLVDTVAPTAVATITALSADTGTAADFTTNTASQTISGTYTGTIGAGETLKVSLDNGVTWVAATTATSGAWTLTGATITTNTIKAAVFDSAGNFLTAATQAVVLDTTADAATALSVAITATVLNSTGATMAAFTVTGLDADAIYQIVFTDAAGNSKTVVDFMTNGVVDLTIADDNSTSFVDGTITATIVATDTAGNTATGTGDTVVLDNTAPTLSSSTPADEATAVNISGNIVLTFAENILAGTGDIIISNGAGDTRTISVSDTSQVTISGTTVTINPTGTLNATTAYNVQMASGVLIDTAGNAYVGILDATTLNFITGVADAIAPTLLSSTPVDTATGNIVLTFSENIIAGTGNIVVSDGAGDTRTIAISDGHVSITDNIVTFNTITPYNPNTTYYVQIASGVLTDTAGNPYAGISDTTTLNFSTPDTIAPTVVDASFAAGNPTVMTLTFSEAILVGSATPTFLLNGTTTITPSITPVISGNTMTVTFAEASTDSSYILMNSPSNTVTDLAGNPVASGIAIAGSSGASTIDLSTLNGYSNMVVFGSTGNDTLIGTSDVEYIVGGEGTDTISSRYGTDIIDFYETTKVQDVIIITGDSEDHSKYYSPDYVKNFDVTGTGDNDAVGVGIVQIGANSTGLVNGTDTNLVAQHSITAGIVSFFDTAGAAIVINQSSNYYDAIAYLEGNLAYNNIVGFALDTDNSGSADSLAVYQSSVWGETSVVILEGMNGKTLGTTSATDVVRIVDKVGPEATNVTIFDNNTFKIIYNEAVGSTTMTDANTDLQIGNGNFIGSVVSGTYTANGTTAFTIDTASTFGLSDYILMTTTATITDTAIVGNVHAIFEPGEERIAFGNTLTSSIDLSALTGDYTILNFNSTATSTILKGGSGNDFIEGGSGADTITGGQGADDIMSGHLDTHIINQGDSTLASFHDNNNTLTPVSNGDTFTFANGFDQIDYWDGMAGNTSVIQLSAGMTNVTSLAGTGLIGEQQYALVRGWMHHNTGVFTINDTYGESTLVVYDGTVGTGIYQMAFLLNNVAGAEITSISGNLINTTVI